VLEFIFAPLSFMHSYEILFIREDTLKVWKMDDKGQELLNIVFLLFQLNESILMNLAIRVLMLRSIQCYQLTRSL